MADYKVYIQGPKHYKVQLESNLTEAKVIIKTLFQRKRFEADATMAIQAMVDYLTIQKNFAASCGFGIASDFEALINQVYARMNSRIRIDGSVGLGGTIGFDIGSELLLQANMNLTQSRYFQARTDLGMRTEFDPLDNSTVVQRFFSSLSELQLDASVSVDVEKQFVADGKSIAMLASCALHYAKFISAGSSFSIDVSAGFNLYRLRMVSEMDNYNLSDFDSMSLFDLDYILIS